MSKLTVTYKIKAKKQKRQKKPDAPPSPEKPSTRPVSRAARMLALAYYVERLVDQGAVASYADAARQLGVSRARMSQILALLNLPIPVQEGLLLGALHLSERRVRAGAAGWRGVVGSRKHAVVVRKPFVPVNDHLGKSIVQERESEDLVFESAPQRSRHRNVALAVERFGGELVHEKHRARSRAGHEVFDTAG